MHNHHDHSHSHTRSTKNILIAFLLNLGFSVFEVIGGILTGSTAILSDAVHDLGDSISLGLSFIFQKYSNKKSSDRYPFGYKRLTVIGAIINILVLSIGSFYVINEAIIRLLNPQSIHASGMFIMALVGIIINGISVLRLKGSNKILDRTVALHLLEDLLGWIAVLVTSVVIYFTHWTILDPILSLLIVLVIVRNIYMNTKIIINIMMCATPDMLQYKRIKEKIGSLLPNNSHIDNLKIWSLDGDEHVLTASIAIPTVQTHELLKQIKDYLHEEGIHDSTIEFS